MKILSSLLNNCRESDRQIGKKFGISGGAVGSRINKMKKSGLIENFCMKVEPPVLGQNIVYIVVSGQDIEKIMKQVKLVGLPFVIVPCVGGTTVCGIVVKEDVEILYRNQAPIASLDATYGGLGQQVKVNSIAFFDGGASSDPDGDVLEFEWDFGDGGTSSLLRPNHEYTSIGNYTVTLTVKDASNESSTAQTWVLVSIRTYNVEFIQNEITVPAFAGYTAEGATTTQNHAYPYNLTSVIYDLEWEEDEDLDSPENPIVGTLFPDDFSLGVSTNYLFNLTDNGTSGNLDLEFDVLSSIPEDLILSLGSEAEVNQYLFQNGYTSAKGQGSWVTSITCNDAPSIVPELFNEVDQGNDWILYVSYTYYESIVTEI